MGDSPPATVGPVAPRDLTRPRRHRPLTGTAGLLLFVCMFLPAMKGCSATPVLPLDVPPFLPPYLYGLVFALVAHARTARELVAGAVALRVLATIISFAGMVVFVVAPGIGIVELAVGLALIATVGTHGASELRVAATALVMGAVCTLWFGLWSATGDALLGVRLSLASSVGLLAGGAIWFVEARRPPARVPIAMVRRGWRRARSSRYPRRP